MNIYAIFSPRLLQYPVLPLEVIASILFCFILNPLFRFHTFSILLSRENSSVLKQFHELLYALA